MKLDAGKIRERSVGDMTERGRQGKRPGGVVKGGIPSRN